jgi:capsular polysaccharide biosynthesis protein
MHLESSAAPLIVSWRRQLHQILVDLISQWPWIFPRGIESSARDWIARAQKRHGWYHGLRREWQVILHAEGLVVQSPPPGLPRIAQPEFNFVASRRYPDASVSFLTGAHLFGDEGLVLTRDNRVLAEFYHQFNRPLSRIVFGRPFGLFNLTVQRSAVAIGLLASPQNRNYYHWLFDALPRWHLLERWHGVIEQYAVPDNLASAQLETLRLLGVTEDKMLPLKPGGRLRCQYLYVPSLPGSEGCYPPWSLDFLREKFLPHAASTPGLGPLIYIQRGLASKRPVLNEPELIAMLEPRGFRAVALESHSFLEQVAIFRDARVIVAAHGAGLANLAFATKSSALLELYSPDYIRPDCFFTLARARGLTYDLWIDGVMPGSRRPWGSIIADLPAISTKLDHLKSIIDGKQK